MCDFGFPTDALILVLTQKFLWLIKKRKHQNLHFGENFINIGQQLKKLPYFTVYYKHFFHPESRVKNLVCLLQGNTKFPNFLSKLSVCTAQNLIKKVTGLQKHNTYRTQQEGKVSPP